MTRVGAAVRLPFRKGRLLWLPEDMGEALRPGALLFNGHLGAKIYGPNGELINELDLGSGLVTTAGVNYLAGDFAGGSQDITTFNYHDSGTGTTAAVIGDTALQTAAGPTTRATGVQSNPTAPVYRSVGTIAYTGTLAITEWGLFTQASRAGGSPTGGTMWDHRVFSAINVVNGDSIEFTYNLTCNAGG